uniref:Uncharacterized protein n=1 Tax=Acrobeloides nanus TaxID=290746 RepID=A0A914DDC1_9BILA
MSVCTAHSTAGVTNHDEYAEIGNNNNNTLPDGDIRIRQRMEASRHGMLQLESLRTKHLRLMEQLRNEYPDYTIPTKLQYREKKSPLHAAAIFNTVAAAILSPQE